MVEVRNELMQIKSQVARGDFEKDSTYKLGIVVAGHSLLLIDSDESLRELFLYIADHAHVVLACRVSPKQKADVVNMVRKRHSKKTTLAIGDGANDVSMILQSHVGVGILGKEGQQAARAADFAIG